MRSFSILVIDKANQTHIAEVLSETEYLDEGRIGCEIIARNYAEENGIQYRNWKVVDYIPEIEEA